MLLHIGFLNYSLAVAPFLVQSKKEHVITINQYSYCITEKDLTFKEALETSSILLRIKLELLKHVLI